MSKTKARETERISRWRQTPRCCEPSTSGRSMETRRLRFEPSNLYIGHCNDLSLLLGELVVSFGREL